ncbi:MAG: oligosaccharide flippase family protein [Planctomycetes bacterium]|nr:oligosaccharide flippase family protein [Planctomycetota bacterium]
MKTGIQDFNIAFVARIIQIATQIGGQSCMAWCLGTEGRGSYAICLLFALMLILIFSVGCDISTVYFVASKKFTISEGLVNALVYGGIASTLAILAGLILMQVPLPFFDKAASMSFYLALASIPFILFYDVFIKLLTAIHLFRLFGVISIINGFGYLLFMVLFLKYFSWGVNGAILAVMLNGFVGILLSLVLLRRNCTLVWARPSLCSLVEMLHYGARYYIGKLSNQVNCQVGTIILSFFAMASEVGLFAVAMRIVTQIMVLPNTLMTVLMPKSAGDAKGKRELIAQCSRFTALICGVALIVLLLFAKPLVHILFSPAFSPVVPLIQILCLGTFFRCLSKVFVPYLLGTNHPGIASISVTISTIVNLVTIWVLLPRIGLVGAALGVTLSYIVSSIILTASFVRLSGLTVRTIYTYNKDDVHLMVRVIRKFAHSGKKSLQFILGDYPVKSWMYLRKKYYS